MKTVLSAGRRHLAALRLLIALTVVFGIGYPALITGIAQLPGLKAKADGSIVSQHGTPYGSALLGQNFLDKDGNPLAQYLQPRPSAGSYDPTVSGASNYGPESVIDTLDDPTTKADESKPALLTTVCERSYEIGQADGVDGSRPFCATVHGADGDYAVGAVLKVFYAGPGYDGAVVRAVAVNVECPVAPWITSYDGVKVECATYGDDYSDGRTVPVRGDAPSSPAVPADAVTASGSGLDPDISPAYAAIQVDRIAKARNVSPGVVQAIIEQHTTGRSLGFLGQPVVNVLAVNAELDAEHPAG